MKQLLLYICFVFLLLFSFSAYSSATELSIGDTAVDFPEGNKWFGGDKVSLKDNIDNKVTLLYFMKPGCGSCDKFAPHLYRLLLKHKEDLTVVGVTEFSDDKIEEYLVKRVGDYPIIQDKDRSFMNQYIGVINKYPYVAIIDKEGKLSWFGRGKFHSHVTDEVERALNKSKDSVPVNSDGTKRALVVGVDYSGLSLNKLSAPESNAELIAKSFVDAGYTESMLLRGDETTTETLTSDIAKLATDSKSGDSAVFFFSGDAKPLKQSDGSIDLELYFSDSSISLKNLVGKFIRASECKNLLVVVDANNENSTLEIWEDIAADVGKAIPEATIILSAARWDRSMLDESGTKTIFSEMFAESIANSTSVLTPYKLWKNIRDEMSIWSRPSGILQSPFIANSKDFSIGKAVK